MQTHLKETNTPRSECFGTRPSTMHRTWTSHFSKNAFRKVFFLGKENKNRKMQTFLADSLRSEATNVDL